MFVKIGLIIIFIVWLKYEISKSNRKAEHSSDEFWRSEALSNFVRKKDISNLDYITIPLSTLPFHTNADDELAYYQEEIRRLSEQKILNLSKYSNTDLKLTYGSSNLNLLSAYDQNYTLLVRTLNKWGTLLYHRGQVDEAKVLFEYAISCGSDIGETLLTLARIYTTQHQTNEIQKLITVAEQGDSLTKTTNINSLKKIYEEASHDVI